MSLEIRNFLPRDNETNVSTITDLTFDLVGLDGDQIDISTLSVEIETVSNVIDDETNTILYDLESDPTLTAIQYTGNDETKLYYRVQVIPEIPFDENQSVTVTINVKTFVLSPATPENMEEYETSFITINNGVISDFKFAFIDSATAIPVYAEVLRPNDSTAPTVFHSAFDNWNVRPRTVVRRNQLIISDGYSIDYKNGQILIDNDNLAHGTIDHQDQIDVDYTFNYFTDEEIKAYFKQAATIWRFSPPFGGPNNIYNTTETFQQIFMIGAGMYAYRNLLAGLAFQEKRLIFDNESWDDGWKNVKDIFKELYNAYKQDWDALLEAKKVSLPNIASIVTPSYTLPGGRSLSKECLVDTNYGKINFDDIFNLFLEKKKVFILCSNKNKIIYNKISCIEFEDKKNLFQTEIYFKDKCDVKIFKTKTSADHKFETPKGMIRLKNLKIGDKVFINYNKEKFLGTIGDIGYFGFENCFEIEVPFSGKFFSDNISVSNSRFFRYLYK